MMNGVNKVAHWPGWETVKLIGRGSFGAVYEIQRTVFKDTEKAALKVISIPQNSSDIEEMYNDGYDDESITSTFQSHLESIVAEYSLMRKMNGSANIVNCEDIRYVQHDDGFGWDIFIKMELVTPLVKALPDKIDDDTVIKIAKDMCAALELCKKHDIVHRDVKPQNIFVSSNGDYKLGDFGIAKIVEKTMGGTKIGTYRYMAPEVHNNQPYGASADIYSLGLVLYWLLNDRRMPFLPPSPEKLRAGMEENARQRRLNGEPLPPPAHGSDKLKQIVLKACAFDLDRRYRFASEMLNDLNMICAGTSTSRNVTDYLEVAQVETQTDSVPEEEPAVDSNSYNVYQEQVTPILNNHNPISNVVLITTWHIRSFFKWFPIILILVYLLYLLFNPITMIKRAFSTNTPQNTPPGIQTTEQALDKQCDHEWVLLNGTEYPLVSFRYIPVVFEATTDEAKADALQRAKKIFSEWVSSDATESEFGALHDKYSANLSADDGGLVENASRMELEHSIEVFLFDEQRNPGDVGVIETETGVVLVYFLSLDIYRVDSPNPQYCSRCFETNGELIPKSSTKVK